MQINEPVKLQVIWDHDDIETRVIIAIQQIAEESLLSDQALARIFAYQARRAEESSK